MKILAFMFVALPFFCLAIPPEVRNVVAKQRFPWNGLVDITCEVTGIKGTTNGVKFAVAAVMPDTGVAHDVTRFWVMQGGARSTDLNVHTNGNYHLLWDAQSDLGVVSCDNMVMRVTITLCGVQLWAGGPYWHEMNVGAEKPEDYGYYFWWGDTVGYKLNSSSNRLVSVKDGISYPPFPSSCPTYNKSISALRSAGYIDVDRNLVAKYDAATVHLGSPWRMPTKAEFSALIDNCTTTWIIRNGVYGRLVTGKGDYADRSIFLPAAGLGSELNFYSLDDVGHYWSSSPDSDAYSTWNLYCNSGTLGSSDTNRYYGQSVRPVRGFAE